MRSRQTDVLIPQSLTSFVGRKSEVKTIVDLVRAFPVVTLVGPGGIGKSRIAYETAKKISALRWPVYVVDMASADGPEAVEEAICAALHRTPADTLSFLASRQVLLVIDNCEHVADAVADHLLQILLQPHRSAFLLTSRQPVLPGVEQIWAVGPMALPSPKAPSGQRAKCDAIALFVERVRLFDRGFHLDERSLTAMLSICQRLEGLPLAIEIAASRLKSISPRDLEARLALDPSALTEVSLRGTLRHNSLAQSFNLSLMCLDDEESALAIRLSIFPGSFSLAAAKAVCERLSSPRIEDLLEGLVSKSLVSVQHGEGGTIRYRILLPIRTFLRERALDQADVPDELLGWALAAAENCAEAFHRSEWSATRRELDADLPNLRAAFDHALRDHPQAALRLAQALMPYWLRGSHGAEGRRWLQRALDFASPSGLVLADTFFAIGTIDVQHGEVDSAQPHLEQALALCERFADDRRALGVRVQLALCAAATGDTPGAVTALLACEERFRAHDDSRGLALVLTHLGNVVRAQDQDLAIRYLVEATALAKRSHDGWLLSTGQVLLASASARAGRFGEARRHLLGFLSHKEERDSSRDSLALATAVELAHHAGDDVLAIRCLHASRFVGESQPFSRVSGVDVARTKRLRSILAKTLGDEARLQRRLVMKQGPSCVINEVQEWAAKRELTSAIVSLAADPPKGPVL